MRRNVFKLRFPYKLKNNLNYTEFLVTLSEGEYYENKRTRCRLKKAGAELYGGTESARREPLGPKPTLDGEKHIVLI